MVGLVARAASWSATEGRIVSASIFVLAALVSISAAVLMAVRGVADRDVLRLSVSVMALGMAGAMGYEAFALATGSDITISRIVATLFVVHPLTWLAVYFGLQLLDGALPFHFLSFNRGTHFGILALGTAVMWAGVLLAWRTGWLP